MLTHHKLKVYQQALALAASAEALSASWGRRHAIMDHYGRAAESIGLNIRNWIIAGSLRSLRPRP
jgi:hypothetical protein